MRTRVYIAGPISKGILRHNIRQATQAGLILLKAGFAPLVPQLTCYMDGPIPQNLPGHTAIDQWYESDMAWVSVCDCVLRLEGESVGADAEVEYALSLGKPIFYCLNDLLEAYPP